MDLLFEMRLTSLRSLKLVYVKGDTFSATKEQGHPHAIMMTPPQLEHLELIVFGQGMCSCLAVDAVLERGLAQV